MPDSASSSNVAAQSDNIDPHTARIEAEVFNGHGRTRVDNYY